MNVSEERRKLAAKQTRILDKLYKSVTDEVFDLNFDLSEFSYGQLKDFWIYTSGFLCLNNYEKYDFSDKELEKIFAGEFELMTLDKAKRDELLKIYDKKMPNYSKLIHLETIQDGKFSINVQFSRGYKESTDTLVLNTDAPEFESEYNNFYTDQEKIAMVRNTFAHNTPFISGNELLFRCYDGNLFVSKMWLRGLTEAYANKYNAFNFEQARNLLVDTFSKQANYIMSNQDIDKALSLMKDYFDPVSRDNFYRINNLVKSRVQYIPDFFNLTFDKKADILASLCANNQMYFETSRGTSNPAVIYNLQKLIAKELERRKDSALLTDEELEDYKEKFSFYENKIKRISGDFEKLNEKIRQIKPARPMLVIIKKQQESLVREFQQTKNQFDQISADFMNKIKLESPNMDTMNTEQLAGSSLEVAFNVVCLMGFNSLVTSAFYDDLLVKTDFNNINQDQTHFFKNIDLSKFTLNNKPVDTAAQKGFVLLCLREALCHQNIDEDCGVYYSASGLKQGEKKGFKDVKVTFKAKRQGAEISGRLDDFYNLFSSDPFFRPRKDSIITGNIEIIDDEDDKNQPDDASGCAGVSTNDDSEEME
ncbi:MAG: hypothetical protein IJS74_03955 [Clostridia bacterium]|nr:hypothetical protein [Clostridia bacterium]